MPETLAVACPSCGKALKVPAQFAGKRIKCKGCGETFAVTAPGAKPPAAPAKPAPKAAPAPMPESAKKTTWDDDADNDSTPMSVIKENDIPRCPHCAQELVPPDAVVCVNCGFNNRTRTKSDTKKVYEPDAADWTKHLMPGILAAVGIVVLLVVDVLVTLNMREWMEGGMLESDDVGLDGRKKMYVSPGLFIMGTIFGSIPLMAAFGRIAYKRLVVENRPAEVAMKK